MNMFDMQGMEMMQNMQDMQALQAMQMQEAQNMQAMQMQEMQNQNMQMQAMQMRAMQMQGTMAQNMYGVDMGYGYGMKPIKYTHQQMLQGLRDFVISLSQMAITREEKLEETPQVLRHACAIEGVCGLGMNNFPIPEMGRNIPFYFCKSCGKLYYYKDFNL